MQIILLKPGDEPIHIEAIRLLNNGAQISHERSVALLSEPTYIYILALTDSGEIMGRIYGYVLHRFEQTDLLLYEVDVLEDHQRKGVGKAMLEFVNDLSNERGYCEMWVLTEGENMAARSLYEASGGVEENSPTIMYVFYPQNNRTKHNL